MDANQIRAIRKQLGETTRVFAARFAVSHRTVEDWEQDGRPKPRGLTLKALERLAKRLTTQTPTAAEPTARD